MEDQKPYEVTTMKADEPSNFLSAIERLSANPQVDVAKIQQILEMQEHILDRNAKQAFNAAMVRAQRNMPVVRKNMKNTQTGSKYAGYDSIVKICQPVYTKEGFSVTFYQGSGTVDHPLSEGINRICADVMHEEGHTKTVYADIPVETTGIKGAAMMTKTHATGSAFSYGRSYLMRLIFNIPTGDDDDGNAAGGKQFITEKQLSTILDFINKKDIDTGKFLKYMAVDELELIPAADFGKAIASLKAAKGSGGASCPPL
jgi:hypothetical protein